MSNKTAAITKMDMSVFKTGEILVKEGLVHPDDIQTALAIQEKRNAGMSIEKSRFLGMILCDLNLITPVENYAVLHRYNKLQTLQSELVRKRMVSSENLRRIEHQVSQNNTPLISRLLEDNILSMPELQKLLFDLFHIPFRSISDFVFEPENRSALIRIMDSRTASDHKIIPMVLKDDTILFGITSPDNLLFIQSLNQQYPQFRFKALFIPHSGFSWFYKIIYDGKEKKAPPEKTPVDLSLLMKFCVRISDAVSQPKEVKILYNRYERVRRLLGNPKTQDRSREFTRFIQMACDQLKKKNKGLVQIEFSFMQQDKDVIIMAQPRFKE